MTCQSKICAFCTLLCVVMEHRGCRKGNASFRGAGPLRGFDDVPCTFSLPLSERVGPVHHKGCKNWIFYLSFQARFIRTWGMAAKPYPTKKTGRQEKCEDWLIDEMESAGEVIGVSNLVKKLGVSGCPRYEGSNPRSFKIFKFCRHLFNLVHPGTWC
jgi:hypothetical protein